MIDYAFLPELNFVSAKFSGSLDDTGLRQHVMSLNQDGSEYTSLYELADCRGLDVTELTVSGCVDAGRLESGQPRAEGGVLAVLVDRAEVFGMARAYSVVPDDVRERILVSYSFDDAIDWFNYSKNEREKLERFLVDR